ncbi:MAG: hypothetical protein AAF957_21265 [Planctomycetota bacterium]
MTTSGDTLRPTEDDLFEAYAPEREALEGFDAGVAERLAVGLEEDGTDAADAESVPSSAPTWLRRAATIAPVGSLQALGVVKGAPGAKAGTAIAGASWAAPVAALAVGIAGLLAATKGLRADRADDEIDASGQPWAVPLATVVVGAMVAIGALDAFVGLSWAGPIFGLLQVTALVVIVRVLSAFRAASRSVVAGVCAVLFLEIGALQLVMMREVPHLARTAASGVLMGTAVVLFLIARANGWRGRSGSAFFVQASILFLIGGLCIGFMTPRPFGTTGAELVDWGNRVDTDVERLSRWDNLGRLGLALTDEELEGLDRARLTAAVQAGAPGKNGDVHPAVLAAAFRLDLLQQVDYEQFYGPTWRRRPSFHGFTFLGSALLEVADAQARGLLVGELRDDARTTLQERWPELDDFRSLEDASNVLEIAEAAGFDDLVEQWTVEIPALLEATWVGRRAGAGAIVGFEALVRMEGDELPGRAFASSTDASFHATRLLVRLAASDPAAVRSLGVDLRTFLRYLDGERGQVWWMDLHPYRIEAAIARQMLLRGVELPPLRATVWLNWHALPIAAVLSALIALVATLRAPRTARIWDGP